MNMKLSNQELLLIYDRFQEHVAAIETCAKNKVIIRTLDIPGMGGAATNYPINDAQAELILDSEQYKAAKGIVSKLQPIAEMIRETGIDETKMLSDEVWKSTGISDA